MWGGDDSGDDDEQQGGQRRNQIRDILDDYSVESYSMEDMDDTDFGHISSREYKEYKETEQQRQEKNWYIRLVEKLGFYSVELGETQEKLDNAVKLLSWNLDTTRILSAALVVAFVTFLLSLVTLLFDIPTVFKVFAMTIPLFVLYYIIWYPIFTVQRKVITSSDELILAILYMVIYMRNSPNIEGAVRFAALNTRGTISQDFKRVLWQTEVGEFTSVEQSLVEYARRWQPYNKDFIQSIELLVEVTAEADKTRRENILSEAINNLLDGTREKMKRYARELKMPVSATFGIGVLLPVLGMILFPLLASFMGGEGLAVYLSFTYNLLIPCILYVVIHQTLIKRPPTISTQNVDSDLLPKKGWYTMRALGRRISIPALLPAALVFLMLGAWPLLYYYRVWQGEAILPPTDAQNVTTLTMLRSLLLSVGASSSIGVYFYFGNVQRIRKMKEIEEMEHEFPESLFQLGNALGRGNPIETSIRKAIDNMRQLEISEMFEMMAYNMNEIGMTFEQSIFDDRYGALRHFPSKLIESVMRAVSESSQKGTRIVSSAMMNISKYLKNIYKTEEEIQEQLSETLATMSFLAFVLAPVISGVALGMGTIITKAFYALKQFSEESQENVDLDAPEGGGDVPSSVGGFQDSNPLEAFGIENAVPPDIMQLVIGVYLIQLALLVGMFYVRLTHGKNPIIRKMFTGKVLIVMPVLYAITTLLLVLIFGNMVTMGMVT